VKVPDYFGRLLVRPLKDGRRWALDSIFGFSSRSGVVVQIPIGFTSDFASIPRILWSIAPPIGQYSAAAWIHDWLYWVQVTTRTEADAIFNEAMTISCVGSVKRAIIFRMVRLFGGAAWDTNAKDKARGVKRVVDMGGDVFLASAGGPDVSGTA